MDSGSSYYLDLINRYFSGEATADEMGEIVNWLEMSDDNKALFEEHRKLYVALNAHIVNETVDVDKEWELFGKKIEHSNINSTDCLNKELKIHPETKTKGFRNNLILALRVAAVIVLVSAISFLSYQYLKPSKTIHIAALTDILENKLPDGSSVTLNKGAALEYPRNFDDDKRTAALSGEAYFNIAHDTSRPFIIAARDVRIEVLGTSFYVNSDYQGKGVEVVLTSGSVAVYKVDESTKKVILSPGEKAVYLNSTNEITKSVNADSNYMAFKTGKLVFCNTPLTEVVYNLNRVYHANIKITDKAVNNCLVTTTIDAAKLNIDEALDILNATLYIEITRNKNSIGISGKSCK